MIFDALRRVSVFELEKLIGLRRGRRGLFSGVGVGMTRGGFTSTLTCAMVAAMAWPNAGASLRRGLPGVVHELLEHEELGGKDR